MSTTHINEPTEPNAKSKEGQLLETISLRDYFAAKAMQAYITGGAYVLYPHEMAHKAYGIADVMIKAREKV